MLPSSSTSLWDRLPAEIQHHNIHIADPLTRYINGLLTLEEIDSHGFEIWKSDWQGDLTILPQDKLPTILDGLDLVHSKQMYHRLCILRPGLAKVDNLATYLTSKYITGKDLMFTDLEYFEEAIDQFLKLKDLMIHIPMKQYWLDELEGVMTMVTLTIRKLELLTIAALYGHAKFFQHLLHDLLSMSKDEQLRSFGDMRIIYPFVLIAAARGGDLETFNCILQVDGVNPILGRHQAFRWACEHGRVDIVQRFFTLNHNGFDPADVDNDALTKASLGGHKEIVRILLEHMSVANGRIDKALEAACINGHVLVAKQLLAVKGVNTAAVNNALNRLRACGYR
ncbi:hypothetical protein HDU76_001267 [Blyttiomyces sp. JEL0837]|nr:hypothetical protein HDU76_001267 [Blyttiomyces sp. JEL0837]